MGLLTSTPLRWCWAPWSAYGPTWWGSVGSGRSRSRPVSASWTWRSWIPTTAVRWRTSSVWRISPAPRRCPPKNKFELLCIKDYFIRGKKMPVQYWNSRAHLMIVSYGWQKGIFGALLGVESVCCSKLCFGQDDPLMGESWWPNHSSLQQTMTLLQGTQGDKVKNIPISIWRQPQGCHWCQMIDKSE